MMKKIIACIFICYTINIFSQNFDECYFYTPQPDNLKNEKIIPEYFQGIYYSTRDSLLNIVLTPDSIYFNLAELYIFNRQELKNKGWTLSEEGISGFVQNRTIPALIKGDTVYTFLIQSQLFFRFNDSSVIKQYENILFINKKIANEKWTTCILKKESNRLILAYIDTDNPKEKKALAKIKPVKTLNNEYNMPVYIFNLGLSEYKQYLSLGGFSSETFFVIK
jgi:hypothetical protein